MKLVVILTALLLLIPLSLKAQDPLVWTAFKPLRDIFLVETPIPLLAADRDLKYFEKEDAQRFYSGKMNDTYFFIFSEKIGKNPSIKRSLDFLHSFTSTAQKRTLGKLDTEEFEFEDDEGFFHTATYFTFNDRQYLFHCLSRKDHDANISHFMRSIAIADVNFTPPGNSGKESSSDTTSPAIAGDRAPLQQIGGAGARGGYGSGSGSGTGVVPPIKVEMSSPIRFLSKPKAPYTDMARQYNINGTVRLKIVFLNNGTIGAVTPLAFLPFGLTKNAIVAARSIGFEPKVVNGVKVSTAMTFEYGFNIY